MKRMLKRLVLPGLLSVYAATAWSAGAIPAQTLDSGVIRHAIPDSNFPIAAAVEVPASASLVYLSGTVPSVIDVSQAKDSVKAYGVDTEAQTSGVLSSIQKNLQRLGLTMGDVVKMQVYLVGDPANNGQMDFAGFMRGYTQFFGTQAQPNLPVRSVFQVAGLANPGWLVEIEVVAVRKSLHN